MLERVLMPVWVMGAAVDIDESTGLATSFESFLDCLLYTSRCV